MDKTLAEKIEQLDRILGAVVRVLGREVVEAEYAKAMREVAEASYDQTLEAAQHGEEKGVVVSRKEVTAHSQIFLRLNNEPVVTMFQSLKPEFKQALLGAEAPSTVQAGEYSVQVVAVYEKNADPPVEPSIPPATAIAHARKKGRRK